jgi:flavin-binding protein dodecin
MALDVQELIDAAQERADDLTDAATRAVRNVSSSAAIKGTPFVAQAPALRGAPPVYTGNVDITTDILRTFQDGFAQFKPEMLEGLADYIARFFPECVFAQTENWICNTILYGGTGIPADIEAQIYQRARARDSEESEKLREAAVSQFAGRGFMLPGGVLAARLLEVEQDASAKASAFNRDTAIKQAEIEIENIKFAVAEGVKIRVSILSAISDYLKAYLLPVDLANNRAETMARAKGVLLNSSADYYRAMIAEAELALKAQELTGTSSTQIEVAYTNAVQRATEANTDADVAVANALIAAAGQAAGGVLALGASTETAIVDAGE